MIRGLLKYSYVAHMHFNQTKLTYGMFGFSSNSSKSHS